MADAGDDAGGGHRVAVHPGGREGAELEERASGVEEAVDAVAHEQLAAPDVLVASGAAAADPDGGEALAQVGGEVAQAVGHGRQVSEC